MNVYDVFATLERTGEIGRRICLILSVDREQRNQMLAFGRDPVRMHAIIRGDELTELLLSPNPLSVFTRLIARQVPLTRVSPYKTGGGIDKAGGFFGRTQLLGHVLNREPANYLVVGGRQIGKTSFLKAIERGLSDRKYYECCYISIGDQPIITALGDALSLLPGSSSDVVLSRLRQTSSGRPRFILIDEADLFLAQQAQRGYDILHAFRNLTEEGRCYFIMAGFWRLFELTRLDYHSPIKNFGETLTLGALEPDAARDLVTKPMAALNVGFAEPALVERIVGETGGRANLIAITCNEILKGLGVRTRIVEAAMVEDALHAKDMEEALGGWQQLISDDRAARLDRIIVYAMAESPGFTRRELLDRLAGLGVAALPEEVQASLQRLDLAFILGREGERFAFRVPLFRAMVQEEVVYLPGEVAAFGADGRVAQA